MSLLAPQVWRREDKTLVRLPHPAACQAGERIIYSVSRCILSAYDVPGIVLGTRDTAVNKTDMIPAFLEHINSSGRDTLIYTQVKEFQIRWESTGQKRGRTFPVSVGPWSAVVGCTEEGLELAFSGWRGKERTSQVGRTMSKGLRCVGGGRSAFGRWGGWGFWR